MCLVQLHLVGGPKVGGGGQKLRLHVGCSNRQERGEFFVLP